MTRAPDKRYAQVGDIAIRYDLADYTDPWRTDPPETFLLYSGYCRCASGFLPVSFHDDVMVRATECLSISDILIAEQR